VSFLAACLACTGILTLGAAVPIGALDDPLPLLDPPHPIEFPDPSATPWVVSTPHHPPDDLPLPMQYRRELGIVPLIGGDSDIGLALGVVGSLAAFSPYASPYSWRLELNALTSFKHQDAWSNPFQDYYLKLTVPSLLHNTLSLTGRLAYTRYSTLKYHGLGNASLPAAGAAGTEATYRLRYPHATLEVDFVLRRPWLAHVAADYYYEIPEVPLGSQLAADLATSSLGLRGGNRPFHLAVATAGIGYDSRNDETAPDSGQQHSLSLRYAPRLGRGFEVHYLGINGSLRAYLPIWRHRVMLALRLVGDGLVGDPPFFMLAESVDGYALGGVSGVRGVPAQRYYGKVKTYGNAELRLRFPPHKAFHQPMVWGLVGFFDGGRLWAGWRPDQALDGSGLGLKYGVGGGIRMQWGATFLIRGDVAWSPDASPVGFYFNVGHIF
jgi:outer membrane protein assembly factor BamA